MELKLVSYNRQQCYTIIYQTNQVYLIYYNFLCIYLEYIPCKNLNKHRFQREEEHNTIYIRLITESSVYNLYLIIRESPTKKKVNTKFYFT